MSLLRTTRSLCVKSIAPSRLHSISKAPKLPTIVEEATSQQEGIASSPTEVRAVEHMWTNPFKHVEPRQQGPAVECVQTNKLIHVQVFPVAAPWDTRRQNTAYGRAPTERPHGRMPNSRQPQHWMTSFVVQSGATRGPAQTTSSVTPHDVTIASSWGRAAPLAPHGAQKAPGASQAPYAPKAQSLQHSAQSEAERHHHDIARHHRSTTSGAGPPFRVFKARGSL